jgi:hypothetical protein
MACTTDFEFPPPYDLDSPTSPIVFSFLAFSFFFRGQFRGNDKENLVGVSLQKDGCFDFHIFQVQQFYATRGHYLLKFCRNFRVPKADGEELISPPFVWIQELRDFEVKYITTYISRILVTLL